MTDKTPDHCGSDSSTELGGAVRWETAFYHPYGNYTGYRFKDFRSGCKHLKQTDFGTECAHPENELAGDEEPPCLCDYCPLVETAYQSEARGEANYDDTDYSEGDQPIYVIEQPNTERSGAERPTGAASSVAPNQERNNE